MQLDQKAVGMMIAGLVLEHMPRGHQVQPVIALEEETGGIGFFSFVQYGRHPGYGQQQRFDQIILPADFATPDNIRLQRRGVDSAGLEADHRGKIPSDR